MKMKSKIFAIAASVVLLGQSGIASADELGQAEGSEWVAEAWAPLPAESVQNEEEPTITVRSASGSTWAPGGIGATNTLYVNGWGTRVNSIAMAYNVGGQLANACVDKFEVTYRENGQSKVMTSGHNCALYRTTHTFRVYRNFDPNSRVCGRAHVQGAGPGNWACITIKP